MLIDNMKEFIFTIVTKEFIKKLKSHFSLKSSTVGSQRFNHANQDLSTLGKSSCHALPFDAFYFQFYFHFRRTHKERNCAYVLSLLVGQI